MIVVDASVALKWFIMEQNFESAEKLISEPVNIIAPDRLILEVTNVFHRKIKSKEVFYEQAAKALDLLEGLFIEIFPSQEYMKKTLELAMTLNHSVYDCVYLALALDKKCPLITADKKFVERTHSAGFQETVFELSLWKQTSSAS